MIIVLDVALAVLWFGLAHDWVGYSFGTVFTLIAVRTGVRLARHREADRYRRLVIRR